MKVHLTMQSKLGIIIFILVFVLPLSLGVIINLTSRQQKDYSLENANVNILINPDGSAYIQEIINYRFKGCYKEVYRVPKLSPSVNDPYYLKSISGYCEPECEIQNRGYEFAGVYNSICDTDVSFHVNMDVTNTISKGEDLTQFHYKVWGIEWEKPLKELNSRITFPENVVITDIFFNPFGIVKDYKIDKNIITFQAENLKGFLEIRALMEKDSFILPKNHHYTRELVLKEQETYEKKYITYKTALMIGVPLIIIAIISLTYLLYQNHGKEIKKIKKNYYEREPYEGFKAYQINFIAYSGIGKEIGKTNSDAIVATLLDLVRRKHINITRIKLPTISNPFLSRLIKSPIQFTFDDSLNTRLTPPEKLVYNFFKSFATKSVLNWQDFESEVRIKSNAKKLFTLADKFEKEIKKEIEIKKYFDNKGYIRFVFSSIILIILGIILIVFYSKSISTQFKELYPFLRFILIPAIFMIVFGAIGAIIPNNVFGKFTKKGFDIYKKTFGYRRFITNLTYLRKYPPESVVIWEEHIVFATALGVANKVLKNLKLVVPDMFEGETSSLRSLYKLGFISRFKTTYSSAMSLASSGSHSGGFGGGAGGGGGGGGGGAR